ncbi:hypothetical protein ABEF92_001192 [Exophiala dermatitidis]|uniref:DNL-type domain-containing protein n=1 Tax=Exophiala dermatitidis (strain ATCC 34100 / CBS 525.76 / NIH/UT8656) TaxID=858893 RepID=H6C985_EXODN|nr:uncharacterized protein HMPREF1120_08613 [Exophiala dermatitidis NIH/UT8656]EHY60662.1 hypothetical protein HMPREF1120_08613 [Exophiala dermatitidis NIH/UT8656]
MQPFLRRLGSRPPLIKATFRTQSRLQSTLLNPQFHPPRHQRDFPRSPSPYTSFRRCESSLAIPEDKKPQQEVAKDVPSYQLSFTCKPCLFRSTHKVTKHGYHHGTVLITCPSCKARHVIADHLKVFLDTKSTLEDILRERAEKGQDFTKLLKKGKLGIRPGALVGNEGEEDIEFWEDGTETLHTPVSGAKPNPQQQQQQQQQPESEKS